MENSGTASIHRKKGCHAVLAILSLLFMHGTEAQGSYFAESFDAVSIPANLEQTTGGTAATFDGSVATFPGAGDTGRSYLRTIVGNHDTRSFIAEITVTISGGSGPGSAFFGLGEGLRGGGFNEPTGGSSIFMRAAPTDSASEIRITDNGSESGTSMLAGDGTHRLWMSYDAGGQTIRFAIEQNYTGGSFSADSISAEFNTADNGFDATNAHVFFGGGTSITFDDLVIRPLNRYENWAKEQGLDVGVDDNFDLDSNGDGISNLVHFAHGTDPMGNGGNEGKLPISITNIEGQDYLAYTFPVRVGTQFAGSPPSSGASEGIVYQVLADTDLEAPHNSGIVEVVPALSSGLPALDDLDSTPGPDWEYRTFRLTQPLTGASKGFMWTSISSAP